MIKMSVTILKPAFILLLVLFLGSGTAFTEENAEGENSEMEQKVEEKADTVNINTANAEQLMTLPGIGESTANKIIDYRNKNGDFKTLDQLKEVPGVGEKKYEKMKEMLTM